MEWLRSHDHDDGSLSRLLQTFNAAAPVFRDAAVKVATPKQRPAGVPTTREST
jgi:hypothetical protein